MSLTLVRLCALLGCVLAGVSAVAAAIKLPSIFSDHMVLQRGSATPVWGWAGPGEKVSVKIGSQEARASADAGGAWKVTLDLSAVDEGPHTLVIEGSDRHVVSDVLIGEVWIASGQSNMAQRLKHVTGGLEEASTARRPLLRMFDYKRDRPSLSPERTLDGGWTVCDPSVAGNYSAVAYFHGRYLQEAIHGPVGMVHISMGGTAAESWMSSEAIESDVPILERRRRMTEQLETYPSRLDAFVRELDDWTTRNGRTDKPPQDPAAWSAVSVDESSWKSITLPGLFADQGLPDSGAVWLRKHIPVTAGMAGQQLVLKMGNVRDYTTIYWNGTKIGETRPDTPPSNGERWTYRVPASLATEGTAVLAVRVYSPTGGAGQFAGVSGSSFLVTADPNNSYFLRGEWLARTEYALPPTDSRSGPGPVIPAQPPELKSVPGVLYNGHVEPVRGFGARGFIWYQGESNQERAFQYRVTFPALIADWRKQWGAGDLPFYFCQLPGFGAPPTSPGEANWAEVRESQSITARTVRQTAMAVLLDLGEESDIHPRAKREAGRRLANVTLANAYNRQIDWKAAEVIGVKREGTSIRVRLAPVQGGLKTHPLPATYQPRSTQPSSLPLKRNSPASEIEGLAICGADRKWAWANGHIDGDEIVVSSPEVSEPVAVRYAWSNYPFFNLYSGAGLPVAPFRTDMFPVSTEGVVDD